jgi:hypothetical protein
MFHWDLRLIRTILNTVTCTLFGRELRLPGDLLFGTPPDKELPTIDHAAHLVDRLHDIHNYARKHLKLASDRIKTRYDSAANCAGYHEGDNVWLYRPTRKKGRSPKLQSPWEGPHTIVTRINGVVYRIQRNPRSKMIVVHLDRLGPYRGTARDERSRREQWERLASNNSESQPTRKEEVWTPPEPEEEATGGLRADTAGAPTTFKSTTPLRRKWWTTGVGYWGRAALRREQCDVHAVSQQSTVETLVYNRC